MSLGAFDRLEIRDLFSRYCIAVDTDDRETFAELFSPEGEWYGPTSQLRTPEEFAQRIKSRNNPVLGRHVVSSVLVDADASTPAEVNVRADFVFLRQDADVVRSAAVGFVGVYQCEVRNVDGAWRFKRMKIVRTG